MLGMRCLRAEDPQKPSPKTLFFLPPELRNKIYDFALLSDQLSRGRLRLVRPIKEPEARSRDISKKTCEGAVRQNDISKDFGFPCNSIKGQFNKGIKTSQWPVSLVVTSRQVNHETYMLLISRVRVSIPYTVTSAGIWPGKLPGPLRESVHHLSIQAAHFRVDDLPKLADCPNLTHLEIILEATPMPSNMAETLLARMPPDLSISLLSPTLKADCLHYGFNKELTAANIIKYRDDSDLDGKANWRRMRGNQLWFRVARDFCQQTEELLRLYRQRSVASTRDSREPKLVVQDEE